MSTKKSSSASSFGLHSLKEVVAELEAKQKSPPPSHPPFPPLPPQPPNSIQTKISRSPEELPLYVRNDPGFRCLTDQLARVRAERKAHEDFKRQLADAEEESCQVRSNAARREADEKKSEEATGGWVRAFDDEANAEYFYNQTTGEASWLPPPNEG